MKEEYVTFGTAKLATFKFNSGMLALLCSDCRVILKNGSQFNELETKGIKGEAFVPPQYCEDCKQTREDE